MANEILSGRFKKKVNDLQENLKAVRKVDDRVMQAIVGEDESLADRLESMKLRLSGT